MFKDTGLITLVDAFAYTLATVLILFSLLGLYACGHVAKPEIVAAVTETVTEINAASIAVGGDVLVTNIVGTSDCVTGPGVGWATVCVSEDIDLRRCGYYEGSSKTIGVRFSCESFLATLVIHEVGHAMGLGHSSDPTSVMYAYADAGMTSKEAAESLIRELIAHDPGPYPTGLVGPGR